MRELIIKHTLKKPYLWGQDSKSVIASQKNDIQKNLRIPVQ